MALPRSLCRRWRCALRFPNGGFGDFHPRARLFVPCSSPKLPLLCPIGRGSRSKVVARPRPFASHYLRTLRETGASLASRGLRAAPCGHFAALPLVRSTFGLRGFPPNRRVAAHLRRISGYGYSRLTARIVPRDGDACGTRPRTTTVRGAARSGLRGAAVR